MSSPRFGLSAADAPMEVDASDLARVAEYRAWLAWARVRAEVLLEAYSHTCSEIERVEAAVEAAQRRLAGELVQ
jgi:hypothetical protein